MKTQNKMAIFGVVKRGEQAKSFWTRIGTAYVRRTAIASKQTFRSVFRMPAGVKKLFSDRQDFHIAPVAQRIARARSTT